MTRRKPRRQPGPDDRALRALRDLEHELHRQTERDPEDHQNDEAPLWTERRPDHPPTTP